MRLYVLIQDQRCNRKQTLTDQNCAVGFSSCLSVEYHKHSEYVSGQHVMMQNNHVVRVWSPVPQKDISRTLALEKPSARCADRKLSHRKRAGRKPGEGVPFVFSCVWQIH